MAEALSRLIPNADSCVTLVIRQLHPGAPRPKGNKAGPRRPKATRPAPKSRTVQTTKTNTERSDYGTLENKLQAQLDIAWTTRPEHRITLLCVWRETGATEP
jgi:hypothetical protein